LRVRYFLLALPAFFFLPVFLQAQGLYADAGLGYQQTFDKMKYFNPLNHINPDGKDEGVLEIGVRAGLLFFLGIPFYVVFDGCGYAGKYTDKEQSSYSYNSYFAGGGLLLYPLSFLQAGISAGCAFLESRDDMPGYFYDGSKFSYSAVLALDFGGRRYGILIGMRYSDTGGMYAGCLENRNKTLTLFFRQRIGMKAYLLI